MPTRTCTWQDRLQSLVQECLDKAAEIEHGSDLIVADVSESIEANAYRRLAAALIVARTVARSNNL